MFHRIHKFGKYHFKFKYGKNEKKKKEIAGYLRVNSKGSRKIKKKTASRTE